MAVINGNGTPNGTFANDPLQKFTENQIALDGFNSALGEDTIIGNPPGNFSGGAESELIFGTSENDILLGGAGNDTLFGLAGFDTLKGELGNDSLLGDDGGDLLDGGDGADFLAGEKGDDTMLGGSGDDLFQWLDGDGSDLMQGGEGNDKLLFNGSAQGDNLNLSQSGSDVVLQRTNLVPATLKTQGIESFDAINGGGGDDTLNIRNLPVTSGVKFIKFTGGDGNDRMDTDNVSANIHADGGNGNDILVSSNGNDILLGDRGNDLMFGRDGNDRIQGAESTNKGRGEIDMLIGGAGRDTFVLDNFYDDGNVIPDGDAINFFQGFDGTGDFARIPDFVIGEDLIQLSGARGNYELKPITNSLQGGRPTPDMGIFKRGGLFQPIELIAIVQDAPTGLNINDAAQFKFI
ncbi:calcium-binding protein [Microcoleus sp. CAWBG58]|uniref:calcium-binding protein n=1 Tax=Microcoleus sp. CAWBG58 TaxID=2841651 RepID=UPI0025DD9A5B|nr:calcium-binding protein [Microcoleus sp. CAWBG58]